MHVPLVCHGTKVTLTITLIIAQRFFAAGYNYINDSSANRLRNALVDNGTDVRCHHYPGEKLQRPRCPRNTQ